LNFLAILLSININSPRHFLLLISINSSSSCGADYIFIVFSILFFYNIQYYFRSYYFVKLVAHIYISVKNIVVRIILFFFQCGKYFKME